MRLKTRQRDSKATQHMTDRTARNSTQNGGNPSLSPLRVLTSIPCEHSHNTHSQHFTHTLYTHFASKATEMHPHPANFNVCESGTHTHTQRNIDTKNSSTPLNTAHMSDTFKASQKQQKTVSVTLQWHLKQTATRQASTALRLSSPHFTAFQPSPTQNFAHNT